MRQLGKIISYSSDNGPQWAFVIVPEDNENLFDRHVKDRQLQIIKKGNDLRVEFNDTSTDTKRTLGQIIHVQGKKFTDDQITEICREHGLIEGIKGLHADKPSPVTHSSGINHGNIPAND